MLELIESSKNAQILMIFVLHFISLKNVHFTNGVKVFLMKSLSSWIPNKTLEWVLKYLVAKELLSS